MKNIFKNPIVTLLIGILISTVLSSFQNSFIDSLLILISGWSLATILLIWFFKRCNED